MQAIILAGGQGTRLGKYTEHLPKGMLSFVGKSLIERQIETLRICGISDITIVTGHEREKINFAGVSYRHNSNYKDTNMVETLFCAEDVFIDNDKELIVCYSDIVFEAKVLQTLIASRKDICVTVDTDYLDYWSARHDKPELDIESLIIEGDKIIDIGNTESSIEDCQERYVGLLKFSSVGKKQLRQVYHQNKNLYYDKEMPWLRSKSFKKAYMTCLLQAIINEGFVVSAVRIKHGWLEFDTVEDYERAISWYSDGSLGRFFNLA